MIRYALVCDAAHEFESWFPGAQAYEQQVKRGLVTCPVCNSARVSKAIMAPNVARKDRDAPEAKSPAPAQEVALLDEKMQALRVMMREMRAKIMEETTDVGAAFPDEARKIHEGEAEARPIRGEASWDEARALLEDGIEVMPIPPAPEERN
ncbi:MAG: DUF1178 family protein [Hyphomicrobiales bacterium]|nr:DUF1178 family protein [Hyphomicrobiales bacterium]